MSLMNDLVSGVVDSALKEILKKTKPTRRRRRTTSSKSVLVRELEKLIAPAKKNSRKATAKRRSKTTQRRVRARTTKNRR